MFLCVVSSQYPCDLNLSSSTQRPKRLLTISAKSTIHLTSCRQSLINTRTWFSAHYWGLQSHCETLWRCVSTTYYRGSFDTTVHAVRASGPGVRPVHSPQ